MNIRNLLVSMIVCAVPIILAVPMQKLAKQEQEVELTKAEQEDVKKWVQLVKTLQPEAQHIVKLVMRGLTDTGLFELSKMRVGKNGPEHRKEMNELRERLESGWKKELTKLVKEYQSTMPSKKFEQVTTQAFGMLTQCPLNLLFPSGKLLFNGVITEEDIADMKQLMAMYKFALTFL